ncbi:hypothetical protein [Streptomyces acidiscabies]|uniref:Uncharacterized protein n=1 Tax=Streptomyces acidiscabies TaxID=42234 RepID=A0ABU4ME02_9ACTN|nr:hypothetical protein [Streptomyces acidiscabies]MDX3026178.1 hypothetical protein [Streptomyces acidiscabies]
MSSHRGGRGTGGTAGGGVRLKKAERELRSEHAAEVRELKGTVATYANQIQILALRNAELETQNTRLLERLQQSGDNIAVLHAPSPSSR